MILVQQFLIRVLENEIQSSQAMGKSLRLLSDSVEFSGTSKLVFDVWCC